MDHVPMGSLGEESEGEVLLHQRSGAPTTCERNAGLAAHVLDYQSVSGPVPNTLAKDLYELAQGACRRLRSLFMRNRLDGELDDEVRFHLEMQTEDNLRAGMSPAEARHASCAALGAWNG